MRRSLVGYLSVCNMWGCTARLLRFGRHVNHDMPTDCLNALLERVVMERPVNDASTGA